MKEKEDEYLNTIEKLEKKKKNIEKKEEEERKKNTRYTSLYIDKEKHLFCEQIYDGKENLFCCYNTEKKNLFHLKEIYEGKLIYKPIIDEEVQKKAILLPSDAEEYKDDKTLDEEIKAFIRKWLDIPENVLQFAIWNIKRSWVYERFHTLNYLRALGDTGQGKTRFLDTLGYIHYKPLFTSGATTPAPIFRMIDKWRGTLIIDEADFKQSDESQDIIKIINQGYEKGKFIMRCDQNDAKQIQFFDPYCPKILATRKSFTDKATESRCITQVMIGTNREDIPLNLNEEFFKETQTIRNKLLMWRINNYYDIQPNITIDLDIQNLEPRLRQITSSFISLFKNDEQQLDEFKALILKQQEDLISERQESFDGQIVKAIHELLEEEKNNISAQDIIEQADLTNKSGKSLHARAINSNLKSLGFEKAELKRIDAKVKRCIPIDEKHWKNLCKRYGLKCNGVTVVTVVTETSDFFKKYENIDEKENVSANRNNRYNRYNRYKNVVDDSGVVSEELIVDDKVVLSKNSLFSFFQSCGGKEVRMSMLVDFFGCSPDELDVCLNDLLVEGTIFRVQPDVFLLL